MKYFLILAVTLLTLNAIELDESRVKKEIGHMLVVGFKGESVDSNSQIIKDINQYELGGVILFDREYKNRTKTKNIRRKEQLIELTGNLKKFAKSPLFISVDQEGGRVVRLKRRYGFYAIPSAKTVSNLGKDGAKIIYAKQSRMIKESGINCNFAPVVDIAINPQNRVIVKLNRSYGELSDVIKYSKIMIEEQKRGYYECFKTLPWSRFIF